MKLHLLASVVSVCLANVASADNPRSDDYKIWTESGTHLALQHSIWTPRDGRPVGNLRVFRKTDGKVVLNQSIGFMSYIWISPNSKYIVGFSNSLVFTEKAGYNLILLDLSGSVIHKEAIRFNSKHVPDVSESVTEWINFYDPDDPEINLEFDEGKLVGLSFNNTHMKRCTVPIKDLTFKERTKPVQQGGADQPATKPADKPSVKDQTSTPTSKDSPR